MSEVKYNPVQIDLNTALHLLPNLKKIRTRLDNCISTWPISLTIKSLKRASEIVLHDPRHPHYKCGYRMAFLDKHPQFGPAWFSIDIENPQKKKVTSPENKN